MLVANRVARRGKIFTSLIPGDPSQMLVVISPAKRLDFDSTPETGSQRAASPKTLTQPDFLADSQVLVNSLRDYTPRRLRNLMGISKDLAELNAQRFANFSQPFNPENSRPAVLAFKGDVYLGLAAETLKAADLKFAQTHLRILSGLYGVLRPLDMMQAYRLEMGTKLKNSRGKDLYAFWGDKVTQELNARFDDLPKSSERVLINLASNEYFSVIKPKLLNADVVNVTFKDMSRGKYKVISFFAKKARGYMTNFIITNRIKSVAGLRDFNVEGYAYSEAMSNPKELVFLRDHTA